MFYLYKIPQDSCYYTIFFFNSIIESFLEQFATFTENGSCISVYFDCYVKISYKLLFIAPYVSHNIRHSYLHCHQL